MRIRGLIFIFLISIFAVGIEGEISIYLKNWQESFGSVEKNVKVLFSPNLYTAYSYDLESLSEIVHNPEFDKKLPTVIYIHGYLNDGEFHTSVMAVRSAYRKDKHQNFIAIDWSAFSHFTFGVPYKGNISKLKLICEGIALQLELIRNQGCSCYKNFYLVGHSLGGQCSGLIGRHLKKISNNNFIIPRIYALDPAAPGFENKFYLNFLHQSFDGISRNDADYVQVIHSNGNKYGVRNTIGHADFYPNGGMTQPGCKDDSCSHQFAWIFFQESIRKEGGFLARKCDSYDNFLKGNCDSNEISYMGYSNNGTRPMGTYFLKTHPSKFGTALGEEGLKVTDSYLIFKNGTKTTNTAGYGFRSSRPKSIKNNQGNSTNIISLEKFNEFDRNQNIGDSDSQDAGSSE